jgi:predicted XRE-type DNA-binding protein
MSALGQSQKRQTLKGNSAESIRFRGQLATNLRRAAANKSLSLPDVATLAGMTRERVYSIVEATAGTQAIELAVLAKVLGVTTDELVKGGVE